MCARMNLSHLEALLFFMRGMCAFFFTPHELIHTSCLPDFPISVSESLASFLGYIIPWHETYLIAQAFIYGLKNADQAHIWDGFSGNMR